MSKASDTINAWADEVDNISTSQMLAEFEAKVMTYVNSMKQSAMEKLAEYEALNAVKPVDPSTTMAWALLQYAQALKVIAQTTAEITAMTAAITNLSTAIANKASEL